LYNEFLANPANLLVLLGVGFFIADLRLFYQFLRFRRLRHSALLTWPATNPPFSGLVVVLGAVLSLLIVYKLAFLRMSIINVFGETTMLVYYVYAMPLSAKIGRGFYEDGIWADAGFVPYWKIGGLSWRQGEKPTLVLIYLSPTIQLDILKHSEAWFPLRNPGIVTIPLSFLVAIGVSLLRPVPSEERRFAELERQLHLGLE